jgi:flavorubredoxin
VNARIDEIADRIYRISTFVPDLPPHGFTFNQFVVDADEPLLYHTGMRGIFPDVSAAVDRLVGLDRLRWIAFSHLEADESGAVGEFVAACPRAEVAHGALGCDLSLNDLLDRAPRALAEGEVLDLGGRSLRRRVKQVSTPHVPHNWEAQVFFEEETGTLFSGDLGTQLGDGLPAVTGDDLIEAALEAESMYRQVSNRTAFAATVRTLAELQPSTVAIMHGASFHGDGGAMLRQLADAYEERFPTELDFVGARPGIADLPPPDLPASGDLVPS